MKKGIICALVIAVVCSCFAGFAGAFAKTANGIKADAADSSVGWAGNVFTELDYGIYWYGDGVDVPVKAGTAGANFDASKPTVIFAHGNKNNEGYRYRDLMTLWGNTNAYFDEAGFDEFEYNTKFYQWYIDAGYNVGHFYWSQIADDDITCDMRVWSSNSKKGMNYSVSDEHGLRVQGDASKNPTKSVAVLFGEAVTSALGATYDKPLQIMGHSMGGQLTLAVTEYLIEQVKAGKLGREILPERITLLDPYFGPTAVDGTIDHLGGEPGNNRTVSELSANAMEKAADFGIAVDAYGANNGFIYGLYRLFLQDKDKIAEITKKLYDNCAWVHLTALQEEYTVAKTHCMVVDYYYSTLYESAKIANSGDAVPYALSTPEEIKMQMGNGFSQANVSGNPFYMHNSTFSLVDEDIKPLDEETPRGKVMGFVKGETSAKTVKLLDENGDAVAEDTLNMFGEYVLSKLSAGTYTLAFYDEKGKELKVEPTEGVSLSFEETASESVSAPCVAENKLTLANNNSVLVDTVGVTLKEGGVSWGGYVAVAVCGLALLIVLIVLVKRGRKQ